RRHHYPPPRAEHDAAIDLESGRVCAGRGGVHANPLTAGCSSEDADRPLSPCIALDSNPVVVGGLTDDPNRSAAPGTDPIRVPPEDSCTSPGDSLTPHAATIVVFLRQSHSQNPLAVVAVAFDATLMAPGVRRRTWRLRWRHR